MTWKHALIRRSALGVLAFGLLMPSGTLAQTGHQPLTATPEAATPAASPEAVPVSDWQVDSQTALDIEGMLVALSPDGLWLAGLGPERSVCVWEVATLEPTCDTGAPLPVSEDSITWSPDSTAVAFTEDVFRRFEEGDIHIFEPATGQRVNLTDDGIADVSLLTDEFESLPLDTVPTWAPDSQSLYFARSDMGGDRDVVPTELMRVSRQGGEAEFVATLHADGPLAVFSTMYALGDGSLVYALNPPDIDNPDAGIWRLSPEGDATQLMTSGRDGAFPMPMLTDVHEGNGTLLATGISGANLSQMSLDGGVAFVLNLSTGEVTPLAPDASTGSTPTWSVFSPDGGTVLSTIIGPEDGDHLQLQGSTTAMVDLGPGGTATGSIGGPTWRGPQWSDAGVVFIPRGNLADPYLLTVSPITAS